MYVCAGVLGYDTRLDDNGNAEGNFTLLAFKSLSRQPYSYSMVPVADFAMTSSGDLPVRTLVYLVVALCVCRDPCVHLCVCVVTVIFLTLVGVYSDVHTSHIQ